MKCNPLQIYKNIFGQLNLCNVMGAHALQLYQPITQKYSWGINLICVVTSVAQKLFWELILAIILASRVMCFGLLAYDQAQRKRYINMNFWSALY